MQKFRSTFCEITWSDTSGFLVVCIQCYERCNKQSVNIHWLFYNKVLCFAQKVSISLLYFRRLSIKIIVQWMPLFQAFFPLCCNVMISWWAKTWYFNLNTKKIKKIGYLNLVKCKCYKAEVFSWEGSEQNQESIF